MIPIYSPLMVGLFFCVGDESKSGPARETDKAMREKERQEIMEKLLFTSESVTEGHPDKVCDAISDAILDALMEQDPMSRVACETCTTTGLVMVLSLIHI